MDHFVKQAEIITLAESIIQPNTSPHRMAIKAQPSDPEQLQVGFFFRPMRAIWKSAGDIRLCRFPLFGI